MNAQDHLRRTLPLAPVVVFAGATLTTGRVYLWFVPVLLAVGLSGYLLNGWPSLLAPVLAVSASLPWVPTVDRAVLLGLITTITWTSCRLWARQRQEGARRAERERSEAATAAVADERLRIARDLHDMVSHGMSVITIQARYGAVVAVRDPAAAQRSLEAIDETGQETLRQLRQMLDVLRRPGSDETLRDPLLSPAPGVSDIPALLQRTETAGLAIDLESPADLRLPMEVGLCTYRVVQEGVANVLRHSGARRARLSIEQTGDNVRVTLTNETAGRTVRAPIRTANDIPVPRHGLIGIRERVTLLGGSMEAGAGSSGDYTLQVVLPCTVLVADPARRS